MLSNLQRLGPKQAIRGSTRFNKQRNQQFIQLYKYSVHAKTRDQIHKESIENPHIFWQRMAQSIDWFSAPKSIVTYNDEQPTGIWFKDGVLNTSYNCLDRHLETHGDKTVNFSLSLCFTTYFHFIIFIHI